jgi:hypothetical protein
LEVPSPIYRLVITDSTMLNVLDTKTAWVVPPSACSTGYYNQSCKQSVYLTPAPPSLNTLSSAGTFSTQCGLSASNISNCNFTSTNGLQGHFNYTVFNLTDNTFTCIQDLQGTSGVFTCDLGDVTGNVYRVQLQQIINPSLTQLIAYVGKALAVTYDLGLMGLLAGIFLFMFISLVGVSSARLMCLTVPLGVSVPTLLGFIKFGTFGSYNALALGGVWVVGIVCFIVMKREV